MAHVDAGRDGRVIWPPPVDVVVGCEVKASYFDGEIWKSTHEGRTARIYGQLDYLAEQGVNRVAFLHLASTTPTDEQVMTWAAAERQMDLAHAAGFPQAFHSADRPHYGYLRGLMGAVPEDTEDMAGVHEGPWLVQAPSWLHADAPQPWRERLAAQLATLPNPMALRTFIMTCPHCRRWGHTQSPYQAHFLCPCIRP
jgi:hypothetical protein